MKTNSQGLKYVIPADYIQLYSGDRDALAESLEKISLASNAIIGGLGWLQLTNGNLAQAKSYAALQDDIAPIGWTRAVDRCQKRGLAVQL